MLTEINTRDVDDVCIVMSGGLGGLPDSIGATCTLAIVQPCPAHDGGARSGFRVSSASAGEGQC